MFVEAVYTGRLAGDPLGTMTVTDEGFAELTRLVTGLAFTGNAFGYHMWTEIYTGGRWVAYDGTLGLGVVPATHIAMMKSAHEDEVMGMGSHRLLDIVNNISVHFEWYHLRDGDRVYTEPED